MAESAVRYTIDGFGQVELNQVAFRRDGRIEAQCELDATDFASIPAENGMLLAIDNVNRIVHLPAGGEDELIALNYTSEHMYDERHIGLKDFALYRGSFLPRLGYLAIGDKFTTNCLSYLASEFATDADLEEMDLGTTDVYGEPCANGTILVTTTKSQTAKVILKVVAVTTMPDGQFALKFQVLAAN